METKQELLTLNGKEYLLDIEQAEKLGLLKEKDSRVKSWKDFPKKYDKAYIVDETSAFPKEGNVFYVGSQLTTHEAKAITAFSKLLKLRRDWIGEWEPNYPSSELIYMIVNWSNYIQVEFSQNLSHSLSFPTKQMAQEFLETFRDLIEEAKILI